MQNKLILGIDTSNYTTSLALLTDDGKLIANQKLPLPVKSGECGLRQSDAVFAHIKNLPQLMKEIEEYLVGNSLLAVGVSTRPRNIEGSYMPCFLAGVAAAQSVASTSSIPLYTFSHQCGHIMAALFSAKRFDLLNSNFCAFHVSGGTTEVLRVKHEGSAFLAELVGGTEDINAGQLIDRVGVAMGLSFPCGAELERLASAYCGKIPKRKVTVRGLRANLSGFENIAKKLYAETADANMVSAFVLDSVAETLSRLAEAYIDMYGDTAFLFAGGVMSNRRIREMLSRRFDAAFAEPMLSCDNAVGIAELARRKYMSEVSDGHFLST